jgi:hypothetical protein
MKKQHSRILIAIALLAAAGVGALAMSEPFEEFWSIDACLDAGGSWNYDANVCDGARDQQTRDDRRH